MISLFMLYNIITFHIFELCSTDWTNLIIKTSPSGVFPQFPQRFIRERKKKRTITCLVSAGFTTGQTHPSHQKLCHHSYDSVVKTTSWKSKSPQRRGGATLYAMD